MPIEIIYNETDLILLCPKTSQTRLRRAASLCTVNQCVAQKYNINTYLYAYVCTSMYVCMLFQL